MERSISREMKRGQTIAFRIPSDTPDHILRELQKLKEKEKRNFSSKIAEYVVQGVNQTIAKERETVTIPLPQKISKEQRDWLKHEHSEALLGGIVYQLITNPMRATSLFAALMSQSTDIDEALYLQEDSPLIDEQIVQVNHIDEVEELDTGQEGIEQVSASISTDDDLDFLDWSTAMPQKDETEESEENEEDVDDLLGGFLSSMNK